MILDDAVVGSEARKLFADAKEMLEKIVAENWLTGKSNDRFLAGRQRR
jgi:5-methyltetrahydrofolate--homocysteine methyltransferase